MLCAFHEHPTGMGVAAFGDGTLPSFASTAVFSGDESEEGHEFARMGKSSEVAEFADDGHGGDFFEAFTSHESFYHGLPPPISECGSEAIFEPCHSFAAEVNGLNVFF